MGREKQVEFNGVKNIFIIKWPDSYARKEGDLSKKYVQIEKKINQ